MPNFLSAAPALFVALQLPRDLETEFQRHAQAWANFCRFPPFYRRMTVAWVASAKKSETRLKRLNQLAGHSVENRRIKFI
jgi:uncharacterized protein YdeI (YjbR/CyaY-like superfamily)